MIGEKTTLPFRQSAKIIEDRGAMAFGVNGPSESPVIEARILQPLYDADWDRLVLSHPEANFFHSAAWARVVCKTYGHEPIYIRFTRGGELVALIPLIEVLSSFTGRRGVCLPFSDLCPPLVFDGDRLKLITEELSKIARERKWKYFEIRGGRGFEKVAEPATIFYGHKLDLRGGSEKLFDRFTNGTSGAIRKAERSALNVEVLRTREAVLQFYALHVRTRRRHGLPPQPASFFLNIHENIIERELGFVVLAKNGSEPVAGAIFFQFDNKAIYKFAASDETHQELRGNNLVLWEAIKFLVIEGVETLHFGRTSLDNDGLRRFKLSWGAEQEMINYYRFDIKSEKWITTRRTVAPLHHDVFSRLPLSVNRLAGAMIYPHLD